MKLNELIGKQIFSIFDANFVGTIHDIAFSNNYTKILGVYFFDQEENEYYIKHQNIYSIDDFLTIRNMSKISNLFMLDKPLSPLGKQIISVSGKNYGAIIDLTYNEKYEIENFITTENKSISPTDIILISKNIVIGEQVKIYNFKPKKQKETILPNLQVSIMKMPEEKQQKIMPTKITVNTDILIGKKLSKDIFGKNNELILKQNQAITPKLLMIAKQHDKLNELFYNVY